MTSEIKLDYDNITTRDIQLIFEHRGWLIKYFGILKVQSFITDRGYHVLIVIERDLPPEDVLLLQILMGSDIQRDIYNFIRHCDGDILKNWSRLYTKKNIILKGLAIPVSGEEICPQLQTRILDTLEDSKDWRGLI
jgi:hypothetical protein